MKQRIRHFLVRDDPEYDAFVDRYQVKTPGAKVFYLVMHLVPGMLAYLLINVPSVYRFALRTTGLSDVMLQGCTLLAVIAVWHTFVPLIFLRVVDRLSFRETIAFLGLRRFDVRGFFAVMPTVFAIEYAAAVSV